jgi:hypothetical protein
MKWLINRWDISKNWQLLYPIIGTLGLVYIALKLALLFELSNTSLIIFLTSLIFIILLVVTLSLFKFLEKRWKVDQKWKVIRIFMVFAVTGSLSIIIAKPIFESVGLIKENFSSHFLIVTFFYILKFILVLPLYKVLLVFFGWLFGEYKFFLNFTIKLANRLGLKKLTEKIVTKQ